MNAWDVAVNGIKAAIAVGVKDFVLCAGARNAMLLEVIAQAEESGLVRCWSHFDERAAGFFALGRCMAGHACAVVTTSGTAAAELLPAVIEAHYQGLPLLAMTADRPARFRGTGAPQSMEQRGLFGEHAESGCVMDWTLDGPFHCNLEMEEAFVPQSVDFSDLPVLAERSPWRLDVGALSRWIREGHENGIVAIVSGLREDEQEEVWHFLEDWGVPVIAEATSGLREAMGHRALMDGDRLLRQNLPGKVLRIGGIPSGRFWRDLEQLSEVEVFSVSRIPYAGLARESSHLWLKWPHHCGKALKAVGRLEKCDDPHQWLRLRMRRAAMRDELLQAFPESEPGWVRTISGYAGFAESLYLGNSMPIREWNLFAQETQAMTRVKANRGMNGIDGQLATWLGWTADEKNAWCMVGDLTALYDSSALHFLSQCEKEGRMLVVMNNGGGRIFDRLPRLKQMHDKAREWMLQSHTNGLREVAAMWGTNYAAIHTAQDLDAIENVEGVMICEIFPELQQSESFWRKWDALHEG